MPQGRVVADDLSVHGIGVDEGVKQVLDRVAQDDRITVGGGVSVRPHAGGQGRQIQIAASVEHLTGDHVLRDGVEVADDHAAEAPLVTQDLGQQTVVAAGPAGTDAVEGGHHATGLGFLHSQLEGAQVDLAQALLGQPAQIAADGTVGLLFVCLPDFSNQLLPM